MKHTQGEWKTEGANVLTEIRLIANCTGNGSKVTEEDKANAKLIAAAPDLLLACQYIESAISSGGVKGLFEDEINTILSAIKKATQ